MILLLIAACSGTGTDKGVTDTSHEVDPGGGAVTISPETLDFGEISAPVSATLTISNGGSGDLNLLDISSGSDSLDFEVSTHIIAPGASAQVTVTWSPPGPEDLDDAISIFTLSTDGGDDELSVPVTGSAAWPVLTVTADATDLGTVDVGCDAQTTVYLQNTGTTDLIIDSVELVGATEFSLGTEDAPLPELPLTITPGVRKQLELVYAPLDDLAHTDKIRVTSNDPLSPETLVDFYGQGNIEEDNSMSFDVGVRQYSTVLFGINEVVNYGTYSGLFTSGATIFFDTLNDAGIKYRVAFLTATNGSVYGSESYIDETFSTSDAVTTAQDMISTAAGDNDYLLATFDKAIEANRTWLLDENSAWADSKLTMIAINNDVEQSSGNATVYVSKYWTYKENPDDIKVSAITGDFPRGCMTAEPSESLYNAADLTGGLFLSFCDTSWDTHFEDLANAVIDDYEPFILEGVPAEWSIKVYEDNVPVTTGWSFDETTNEIVFEEDAYPTVGSTLRVDYIMVAECE